MTASAKKGGKLIALTFDDGPGPYTNRLLDGLAERGVKATFFMVGQNAKNYSDTVRRVYREGHQIAQHTYDHPTLSTKSDEQVHWQLDTTDDILNGHLGMNFNYLLRPPYGDYSKHTLSIIGKPAIIWSVDTLDWKYRNSNTVRDNIVSDAFDGAIVLMHDIHSTTIDGALMAIDILKEQGYEFVTVNELHRRRGRTLVNGELYYSCKPTGTDLGPISEPTISVKSSYGGVKVQITADSGADIYYTTDGSDPAFDGKLYMGEISIKGDTTVKALASYNLNGSRSSVASRKVAGKMAIEPSIAVENGCVVLNNPNPGTELRYTTDGTAPKATSPKYTAPIPCYDGVLRYQVMGDGIGSTAQTIYVTSNGNLFRDVPNTSWYFGEVDRAVTVGLFNGTGLYCFAPDSSLTRAMFVTVLYRMNLKLGGAAKAEKTAERFRDVPEGEWYSDAVAWAAGNGIVEGYGNGIFKPEQSITREEMCTIMNRAFGKTLPEDAADAKLTFSDSAAISAWAAESVARMAYAGIIRGVGNNRFAPSDTATRAEAAAIVLRMYDYCRKN